MRNLFAAAPLGLLATVVLWRLLAVGPGSRGGTARCVFLPVLFLTEGRRVTAPLVLRAGLLPLGGLRRCGARRRALRGHGEPDA
ncbi:MAG: hypothetical protein JSR43_17425 [Proteobacteria bacterium]|nr:hypothetical protein [Pseudomonadota bacterium]